jgi:hypothetical protein
VPPTCWMPHPQATGPGARVACRKVQTQSLPLKNVDVLRARSDSLIVLDVTPSRWKMYFPSVKDVASGVVVDYVTKVCLAVAVLGWTAAQDAKQHGPDGDRGVRAAQRSAAPRRVPRPGHPVNTCNSSSRPTTGRPSESLGFARFFADRAH